MSRRRPIVRHVLGRLPPPCSTAVCRTKPTTGLPVARVGCRVEVMNDFDDFRRRVRQTDDYTKHRRAFLAALIFAFFGIVGGGAAFGPVKAILALGIGGAGASSIACGLYAIR